LPRRFGATTRDTLASIAMRACAVGLNFIVGVILARAIGPRGYGIYSFALAAAALLAIPSTAALSTLVVREVAAGIARSRPGSVRGVMLWASRRGLALAIATVGLAAAIGLAVGDRLAEDSRAAFGIALIVVPLLSILAIRTAGLRGLHHVVAGQVPELIAVPAVMMLAIAGLGGVGLGDYLDPVLATGIYSVAIAIGVAIAMAMLRTRLPAAVRDARPESNAKVWSSAAIPLLFVSGFAYANREMGLILVGSLAGPEEAGIYRVAVRGADLVVFALTGIVAAISPRLARLHAVGDVPGLRRLVRRSALASLLWALPVSALMILYGSRILSTLFGEAYAAGATSLAILSAGQLVNAATGPVGLLLNMTGRERRTALGHAVALGVQFTCGLVLIPRWGVEGAAGATSLAIVARNAIFVLEAGHVLRVSRRETA
jgi:O-antigen/teichoic acid export membrane protein